MKHSVEVDKIIPALVAVQLEMVNVPMNKKNTFFNNSPYADLGSVLATVRPILAKNGLAIIQFAERVEAEVQLPPEVIKKAGEETATLTKSVKEKRTVVTTRLMHESGQYFENEVFVVGDKHTAQEFGSLVTYMRRYSIMAMCATAGDEDDDGNVAEEVVGGVAGGGQEDKSKKKTAATPPRELTVSERMDKLPQDLKDLLTKINCHTVSQRWQFFNKVKQDVEAMRKEALAILKKQEG